MKRHTENYRKRLLYTMKKKGLSIKNLAALTGKRYATCRLWCAGESRPTLEGHYLLLSKLNVSHQEFWSDSYKGVK